MRVIKRAKLADHATWRNFPDVRATFGQTDVATVKSGHRVLVFDVGGNKFRVIARASYEKGKLYVFRVFTHTAYQKGKWKEEL
jgi:mRNA interferase HigB